MTTFIDGDRTDHAPGAMTSQPPPPHGDEAAAVTRLVDTAIATARLHTADAQGWCDGCLATRGHLAAHPCLSAEWARSVLDRYGDLPTDHHPGEEP